MPKEYMTKKRRAALVLERLDALCPDPRCTLNYSTPAELLIATQLSAQCTDARVNIVTAELFKKYRTVRDFADADYEELCAMIRSAGFYRNKAKNIIACCKRLIEVYNGEVPDTMEELLTLPGTGRKTANLVLGEIFGKPAAVVDTHCIRLTNRIGLVDTKEPDKIEAELIRLVPDDSRLRFCHQMVHHGRACCTAKKPACGECAIAELCESAGRVS